MKSKFVFIVIILIVLIVIFNNISSKENKTEFKPLELEVGDEFTEIDYGDKMFVVNYEIDDVTGDGIKDMIIIIGNKNDVADTMANNIDVVTYDSENKSFIKGNLKKCSLNTPKLFLKDMNGDGINDIVLIGDNEDMTKTVKVLTIKDNESKEVFKNKDNKGLSFAGAFLDGFKAHIVARKINFERNIEINDKRENYITSGFYDESGRVTASKNNITTSGFVSVEFVELNDAYGLKTTQRIKGFDNLDILDQVEVIWKYENGSWNIKEAKGEKLGNLLY